VTEPPAIDNLDRIVDQWAKEMPELDTRPMAAIGRLLRTSRIVERQVESELARFGLNHSEFNVLCALRRAGHPYQLSPADLSRSLLLSSGGLTKRIDRLEHAGLVIRSPDPEDGRGLLVSLTEAGNEKLEVAIVAQVGTEERALAALGPGQRDQLAALLKALLLSYGDRGQARLGRAYRLERRMPATGQAAKGDASPPVSPGS
jgi:DNA-binding MarR family transcriptional regulator